MSRKVPVGTAEDESIAFLLDKAEKLRTNIGNDYEYSASWLKSGKIGDPCWTISEYNKQEGEYTYSFDAPLPDGTSLIDPINAQLLEPVQKLAFHMHMGDLTGELLTGRACFAPIECAINFARWMVLHDSIFLTRENGFRLVTEDHVVGYLTEFALGGSISTLQLIDRLLAILHENCNTKYSLDLILSMRLALPKTFIDSAIDWLEREGAITANNVLRKKIVSRRFLSNLLGCSLASLGAYSPIIELLQQFDQRIPQQANHPRAAKPRKPGKMNKPSSTTITKHTMRYHVRHIKMFFMGHAVLPNEIPYISEQTYSKVELSSLRRDGHTRLLPIEIGLEAIDKAAEIIIVYGEAIVDAVINLAERYTQIKAYYNSTSPISTLLIQDFELSMECQSEEAEAGVSFKQLAHRFNITSYISTYGTEIRSGISLKTLHQAFYGACALLIGMCKPVRDGELYKLKRDCLKSELQGGGAMLTQELEKTGMLGVKKIISRPIPYVTSRAIQLLQTLCTKLRSIYNDEDGPIADRLFYIPDNYVKAPKGKALSKKLNSAIDTYCHLLELPNDQFGRPWLIRIHEMRKFFLLVMYKHHYGRLRHILSYAAGHINPDDIDAYVTLSHDDPESLRYESECISDKLFDLELGSLPAAGNGGLAELYSQVCKHFNVLTLSALSKDKFCRFLNSVQVSGSYHSQVYSVEIEGSDGKLTMLEFAIKYNEIGDEKYTQ